MVENLRTGTINCLTQQADRLNKVDSVILKLILFASSDRVISHNAARQQYSGTVLIIP